MSFSLNIVFGLVLLASVTIVVIYCLNKKDADADTMITKAGTISSLLVNPKNASANGLLIRHQSSLPNSGSAYASGENIIKNSFLVSAGTIRPWPALSGLQYGVEEIKVYSQRKAEFMSGMSQEEKERFEKLKSMRLVLSPGFNKINSVFSAFESASEVEASNTEKFVEAIANKIESSLSFDPPEATESRDKSVTSSNMSINLRFKSYMKRKAKKQDINLKSYLLHTCQALNKWFHDKLEGAITGPRCLTMTLIYLKRIRAHQPSFSLSVFNVHNVLGVLILISAKFSEDVELCNQYWAFITKMKVETLNSLEKELCFSADFNFSVAFKDVLQIFEEYDLNEFGSDVLDQWKARQKSTEKYDI